MRMMKPIGAFFFMAALLSACQRDSSHPSPVKPPPVMKTAYADMADGRYAEALQRSEPVSRQSPSQAGTGEALYLKGYVLVFGQGRLKEARESFKGVVEEHGKGPLAPLAQKTLADSLYWQGDYPHALEEYARLQVMFGSAGWGAYALFQSGNCFLLQHKDGDALVRFRDAAERYPDDPMAGAALLRVAEIYRRLDNDAQAREEFQHVLKVSRDPAVRNIAMDELETIEQAVDNPQNKGAP